MLIRQKKDFCFFRQNDSFFCLTKYCLGVILSIDFTHISEFFMFDSHIHMYYGKSDTPQEFLEKAASAGITGGNIISLFRQNTVWLNPPISVGNTVWKVFWNLRLRHRDFIRFSGSTRRRMILKNRYIPPQNRVSTDLKSSAVTTIRMIHFLRCR